jgi:hypothetical protein
MPVILAGALVVGRAAALDERAPSRRVIGLVLGVSAALQMAGTLPQAVLWRREPDANRTRAELYARHAPGGARLFAGALANHLRWYAPGVDVVSLPELWHDAHARERSADPIDVVRGAARASGKRCFLSSDGAGFLIGLFGRASQAELEGDLARLGVSLASAQPIPGDPKLALFPLGGALAPAGGEAGPQHDDAGGDERGPGGGGEFRVREPEGG